MKPAERGKRNEANLSYEEVAAILAYDEMVCDLYWKVNRRGTNGAGRVAGCVDNKGYRVVKINRVRFHAHRVIWLLVYGRWPTDQIDHIDGNRQNNDIANLREVTNQGNQRNIKLPVTNTSGFIGVCFTRRTGTWYGQLHVNGRQISSPSYQRMESAIAWRKRRDKEFGFHANHGRTVAA